MKKRSNSTAQSGSSPLICSELRGSLWLTVEPSPGSHVDHVCREAVGLANQLGLTVWFDFNGVHCGARPGDDPALLLANWNAQMKSGHSCKVACANPQNDQAHL